jgi:uncharacterized protein YggE
MRYCAATLLAFLPLFVVAPAVAQQTIDVTGEAEIKVVPDQVILSLGVEVHSKTLADARRENDQRVRSVRAAAAKMGVQESDIQTDFIQLCIAYQIDGVTPLHYYTRKSIVLTLRDIGRMEEVLAGAVDAGATHIHGVNFETTKLRQFRDQARALAVKAAGEKARDMAAAAGLKVVGGPTGISSSNYGTWSWYGNGWGYGVRGQMTQNVSIDGGSGPGAGQGTVALGRISVTASVSMRFNIQ